MKQYHRQIDVAQDVGAQIAQGDRRIFGVMVESNLYPGNQKLESGKELSYGVSVTDACIGWDDSVLLLDGLARAVVKRREG